MYGTTAAAAGAVLLRRLPRPFRQPAGHVVPPAGHGVPLAGGSGSFTFVQAGPPGSGTGTLGLSLPGTVQHPGSTKGNLLVATIQAITTDGSALGQFTPPGSGWRLAKSVSGKTWSSGSGRVEIWYFPGTPDLPGCLDGVTSVTFTPTDVNGNTDTNANCRGALTEFGVSAPGMMAVLDAPGQAFGGAGPFTTPIAAASGNVQNALGVTVAGAFFTAKATGTWTGPGTGWTPIRTLGGTVINPWGAWYDLSLGAGIQSISPDFSVHTSSGWDVAFAAFRGVVFQGVYLDGAEMTTMVALDSTGQELVLGGDVEGMWRTADFGDHWQVTQDGIDGPAWRCTAAVAWSQTHPNEVYACVGKDALKNDGGFLVSSDGGVTWSMRAAASKAEGITNVYSFLNFQANVAGVVLPGTEKDDQDRSVGNLIAQTTIGTKNYLYLATYNTGIAVSTDDGFTWSQANFSDGNGNYFLRALALDPNKSTGLYAGAWSFPLSNPTHGGLYHTTDATVPSPAWVQVMPPTSEVPANSTVSDIKVLGGNLYVLFTLSGIYQYQPGATNPWRSLNGKLNASQYYGPWTSLDGYVSSSGHVIVAACSSGQLPKGQAHYTNVVQMTVDPTTGAISSFADLTASAGIDTTDVPPDEQTWWHGGSNYTNWLGGQFFGNPHVLVNPNNTSEIFVTGASGFFRTTNADAVPPSSVNWQIAVNGSPSIAAFDIATDPNLAQHYVICGTDFIFTDVSGDNTGFTAVTKGTSPTPPPNFKYETHAAIFDPRSLVANTYKGVVYLGVHNKYGSTGGENGNGNIFWSDSSYAQWYDTGFFAKVGGDSPTGLCVSISGSTYYLVASTIGSGIWRSQIPSDPTVTNNWSWTQRNGVACTLPSNVQKMPIVANSAGTNLYCFDRAPSGGGKSTGIWRSTDSGKTWTLIWDLKNTSGLTVDDDRSGWLAVNPKPKGTGDELWVSVSNSNHGIYKLAGANTGTVETNTLTPVDMSGTSFPYGAGSIAFTASNATLYAVALNGTNGPAQSSAQLLSLANGGSTWNPGDPGNAFGSYVSWPGPAVLTAPDSKNQQTLLVCTMPNLAVYGKVPA